MKRLVLLTAPAWETANPRELVPADDPHRRPPEGLLLRAHDVQERLTRESGLDFVIARPTRLTNGAAKGKYVRTAEVVSVPSTIARADVADFLVEACESPTWVGKSVHLGG